MARKQANPKTEKTDMKGTPAKDRYDAAGNKILAQHVKITIPSTDVGTYDFNNPAPKPDTAESTITIGNMGYMYMTNPVVFKGVNIRANRVMGEGFKLIPSNHPGANERTAKDAMEQCMAFLNKINYLSFFRQSCINAYVSGNEWTTAIYNMAEPKSLLSVGHGDFSTIDFRRNFISNKIMEDGTGEPVGYWQYVTNLAELYYALSTYYGKVVSWENFQAARVRLEASRSIGYQDYTIDINGVSTGVAAISTTKPNFMFLKKEEIIHLSFNNLNDNHYGVSLLIPAYNSLNQLNQVMYATAEAINETGYPKPVITVGDENHPPEQNLMDLAESMVKDPKRKESFAIPYYAQMAYLQPSSGAGAGNINDYPKWFITAVAMGLRIPQELLTGEGESNKATAGVNSTDFDRDIQAERRQLDDYIRKILSLYLNTHGYLQNQGDLTSNCIYTPRIEWPEAVSEDQALREKMTLEKWRAGLIKFDEARKALNMNEVKGDRGEQYVDGIKIDQGEPVNTGGMLNKGETGQYEESYAQHALLKQGELNPPMNRRFGTKDVNFKQVAQQSVGTEITTVSEQDARKIRDAIVNGEAKRKSAAGILKEIRKIGNYTDEHARMIMVTEQKNLSEHAFLQEAQKLGKKYKKWQSVLDVDTSPICRALHGKVVPIGEDFKVSYSENGKTKTWSGKAPAAHPSCRSFVSYLDKKE